MIDYHPELVVALSEVLPTFHELMLTADTPTPCISYMETNNYDAPAGETQGYSWIGYQVKVWGTDLGEIQSHAQSVDAALRDLGWERTAGTELHDKNSAMIQKVMTYEALFNETY